MLRASLKRIKSAPKTKIFAILGVGMALLALVFWGMVLSLVAGFDDEARPDAVNRLQTSTRSYDMEVAATPEEQAKGLSGRSTLPSNAGMLFVFPEEERQCFWMKNTWIPLDMIWFDANKKVTHIERSVRPDSYSEQFCATGKYVIELNAGQAKSANIQVGQRLDF